MSILEQHFLSMPHAEQLVRKLLMAGQGKKKCNNKEVRRQLQLLENKNHAPTAQDKLLFIYIMRLSAQWAGFFQYCSKWQVCG
jgi:hypothetical protein